MLIEYTVRPLLYLEWLFRFLLNEVAYFHLNILLVLFVNGRVHRPVLVEYILCSLLEIPGDGFGDVPLILKRF